MILGFKKQFVKDIMCGYNIHTIREDPKGRWQPGKKIHFATGTRTKNYNQFKTGVCVSVQKISICYHSSVGDMYGSPDIFIDDNLLGVGVGAYAKRELLAKNDGFYFLLDFYKWFSEDYNGKIIHWTDFRY